MKEAGISHAILSLGHQIPHLVTDNVQAASICRKMNEYMAEQRARRPMQLGFLATIPSLSDAECCIEEIAYAIDVLKADGVVVATSYDGLYLGDESFKPVWTYLDSRAAIVALHPGLDDDIGSLKPGRHPIPGPIVDWSHETTRTATHLIVTGRKRSLQNCKIILPHAGGTLPFVVERISHVAAQSSIQMTPEEFLSQARTFYFDLAISGFKHPIETLQRFAKPGHILYGSDFPFVRQALIQNQRSALAEIVKDDEVNRAIQHTAAFDLFPSLRQQ